jgi:hypothetical protein
MCPSHSGSPLGYGGHVPVGCVATAVGMVMKYHNWPPSGTGTKYHSSYNNGGFSNITVNFENQTYNWSNIPDYASSNENDDLAKINYHIGVAVNMYWSPDGSGTLSPYVPTAFKSYFKYSSNTSIVYKRNYTEAQWVALLKEQIDTKQPMYYAGSSTTAGHAWVCDGYQDNLFHMNWGWGRHGGNGYYALDNLTSTARPGGNEDNFRFEQEAVISIAPNEEFNRSCIGFKTITGAEGSFDDGSSMYEYASNSSCVYIIRPECGMVISSKFTQFDFGSGDVVSFYAGDENSDELIASFDAQNLPGDQTITSYKGAMTIRFNTDGTSNGDGWKLSYNVALCTSAKPPVLTAVSGNFNDGSGSCNYLAGSHCIWRIEPEGDATQIKIFFGEFDLGASSDWVRIYKDTILDANKVGEYKLSNLPPSGITVNSNVAYVRFYTGSGSPGASGWNISYVSDGTSSSDVPDYNIVSDLNIVPNPGNAESKLCFSLGKSSEARVFITNTLGQVIYDEVRRFNLGENEIYINNILGTNIKNGIYHINLQSDGQIRAIKFVVIDW